MWGKIYFGRYNPDSLKEQAKEYATRPADNVKEKKEIARLKKIVNATKKAESFSRVKH